MRKVVIYGRVSTEEQVQGYSIEDQLYTLRTDTSRAGEEVVEEIVDEGFSGADPDRPGLLRIYELAESGGMDAVKATKRDRLFRSRLYRLLTERDLAEYGVKLIALNDTGHRIGDGVTDDFAEWEREQITERTMSGKLQKARSGRIVAGRLPVFGFVFSDDRNHYEVDEAKMSAVRRTIHLVSEGSSVASTARALDAEGFLPPWGAGTPKKPKWARPSVRNIIFDDCYKPHSYNEMAELVSPEVLATLDPEKSYGLWWYNRREAVKTRHGKRMKWKPREKWIAVPVPDAGVSRQEVDSARKSLENNEQCSTAGRREWELSRGILRCGDCGNTLTAHTATQPKKGITRYYYRCVTYQRRGREACSMTRNLSAPKVEAEIWEAVRGALLDPETLEKALGRVKNGRRKVDPARIQTLTKRLRELEQRRGGYIDLAADGLMDKEDLRGKLGGLDAEITALRSEAEALGRRAEITEAGEKSAASVLERMKKLAPERLDVLDGRSRRKLYRAIDLRVLVHQDKSFTLEWLAGVELGDKFWLADKTSTECSPHTKFLRLKATLFQGRLELQAA